MDGSPKEHHASLSNKRQRELSQASPPKIQGPQMLHLFICLVLIALYNGVPTYETLGLQRKQLKMMRI